MTGGQRQVRAATQGGNVFASQLGRHNIYGGSKLNKLKPVPKMNQKENSLSNGFLIYQGHNPVNSYQNAGIHGSPNKSPNTKYFSNHGANFNKIPTTSQGNRASSINNQHMKFK